MKHIIDWVWNLITWCAHATVGFWANVFGFIADPTGHLGTNLVAWIAGFITGWYIASNILSVNAIKHLKGDSEVRKICSKNPKTQYWTCVERHGERCAQDVISYSDVTPGAKRAKVLESMGGAVFWPVIPAAVLFAVPLVVFIAPVVLIAVAAYFVVLWPTFLGTRAIGKGVVNGVVGSTTMIAEKTVTSIEQRASQIDQHKALSSKKR